MNKEVKITLSVDGVDKEIKSINDLKDALKDLGENTEKTEKKTSFFKEQLDKAKDLFSDISKNAKGLKNDFTGFAQGLGLSSKAAKGLSLSLAALGIPLLVAVMTTAIEYFKNFEQGVKFVETATNVFNAAIGQLTDSFVKLFTGDFAGFAKSFMGIGDAISDAVDNTNKQFEAQSKLADLTAKNTVENAKLTRQLELASKVLQDSNATYEQQVQALKDVEAAELQLIENKKKETELILQNLKAQEALENNYEKRRDLAIEIAAVEAALIDTQTKLTLKSGEANKKIRDINNKRAEDAKAAREKQAQIDQAFVDAQVKYAQEATLMEIENDREREAKKLEFEKINEEESLQRSAFNAEQRAALLLQIQEKYLLKNQELTQKYEDEELAKKKAADDKADAERQAKADKEADILKANQDKAAELLEQLRLGSIQNAFARAQEEIDIEYKKNRDLLIAAQASDEQLAALDKAYLDGTKALAEEEVSFKRQQAAGLADSISSLVGESSRVGKIAAIASATINTFEGATKAIAQGGFFGIATAAITIAAGLKNIQKIIQTKVPGEGGGISAPSSLSGAAAAPTFDPRAALDDAARNSTMVNRTGSVNLGSNASPIKTYVVASDMTSEQEKQTKINNLSRL